MTPTVATHMTEAARAWLDALDADQLECATWPWPSDDERHRWYYTPTDHGGLPLARMSAAQQGRAMQLLATGLSHAGYVTVATVMGLENILDHLEGWQVDWGRERGRDPQLYWLSIFGEPGAPTWSWRFGGHHVSLHNVIVNGQVAASTPCFIGADPASSPLLGPHPLRPMGGVEDLARDLLHALDEEQVARALLTPVAPVDIVGGNRPRIMDGDRLMPLPDVWRGHFSEPRLAEQVDLMHRSAEEKAGVQAHHHDAVRLTAEPKGIPASDLTSDQQQLLRDLLALYLGRIPDALAEREAAKFTGHKLATLHFAWAGGVERGQPHYYRIQGPQLLVEYDNTQRDVNHVHSVWRDPDNDFGHDVLRAHLVAFH